MPDALAPTVIVTGASSGVGLYAARSLAARGWLVIMACRDVAKAQAAAHALGIDPDRSRIMQIDLGSQRSVRQFVDDFMATGLPLNALVNNAAVYLPRLTEPARSPEGFEISVATNHLGHFLLSMLLLEKLGVASSPAPRLITLGTVTANSEEFGGKVPIPAPADLGDLQGTCAVIGDEMVRHFLVEAVGFAQRDSDTIVAAMNDHSRPVGSQ
jgi:protochlorophyllide reductase